MQKASVLLLAVGGILGLGIILSVYGSQVLFENLARGEGEVTAEIELTIPVELERSGNGIYAVQTADYEGDAVFTYVLDPYGSRVRSDVISGGVLEEIFRIDSDGEYTLVIGSNDAEPVMVFGVIGPEPDSAAKSLGFVSLYMLIAGLFGMAIVGIYAIRKRRKGLV